jgi:hypothetical protein
LGHEHLVEAPRILDPERWRPEPSAARRHGVYEPGHSDVFVERVLLANPFGTRRGARHAKRGAEKNLLET